MSCCENSERHTQHAQLDKEETDRVRCEAGGRLPVVMTDILLVDMTKQLINLKRQLEHVSELCALREKQVVERDKAVDDKSAEIDRLRAYVEYWHDQYDRAREKSHEALQAKRSLYIRFKKWLREVWEPCF